MPILNRKQMIELLKDGKSAVSFQGKLLTDPKDVPTDEEIVKAREERAKLHAALHPAAR